MRIEKRIYIAAVVLLVVVGWLLILVPLVNNYSARQTRTSVEEILLPESTEYIDSVYAAGKLNGNGNGMQYFGAILLKSDLTIEELDHYYSLYRENDWEYLVQKQEGQKVAVIEHEDIYFKADISAEENYYIVYSWGEGISPFSALDIRGC